VIDGRQCLRRCAAGSHRAPPREDVDNLGWRVFGARVITRKMRDAYLVSVHRRGYTRTRWGLHHFLKTVTTAMRRQPSFHRIQTLGQRSFCLVRRILYWVGSVPRAIRELVKDLRDAGFTLVRGAGKGSHRKFTHPNYQGAVTLSGQDGDDAKKYQEKQIKRAIAEVER